MHTGILVSVKPIRPAGSRDPWVLILLRNISLYPKTQISISNLNSFQKMSPPLKRAYDVAPLMAPIGYVPFYTSTPEYAKRLKTNLEDHYRRHFTLNLDWDEMDPKKHITVTIGGYAPPHLFEFAVTPV